MIVRQFHAVIEIMGSPPDMQNVHESGVCAGDRLERGHAFEFPQKCALAFKRPAIDNFDRAERAGHRPRQPNLTVSAAADHAQQLVIGNNRYLSGNLIGNGPNFTQAPDTKQFAEHRAASCALGEAGLRCPPITAESSGLQTRWAHRPKIYVPEMFFSALISFFSNAPTR